MSIEILHVAGYNPDAVLESMKGKLSEFVLCGYDHEGKEYFFSTIPDGGDVFWLFERMKLLMMTLGDEK